MRSKTAISSLVYAACLSAIVGCATGPQNMRRVSSEHVELVASEAQRLESKANAKAETIRRVAGTYVAATVTNYSPPADGGEVSLVGLSLPIIDAIKPLAERSGFTVQLLKGVRPDTRVNLSLRNLSSVEAIRQIAFLAGLVAVVDEQAKIIRIANEASMTFRVPSVVQAPASAKTKMSFATAGTASSGGGAQAQGGGGGSALASATVTTAADQSGSFKDYLAAVVGDGASISVFPDAGLVTVRGSGHHLLRAREYLSRYVSDGMRQVQLDISIVEVALSKNVEFGIDWERVVPLSRAQANVQLFNGTAITSPALQIGLTSSSIASVIKALEQTSNVRILTAPSIRLVNNASGQFRSVRNQPYVPSVTTTPTGSATSTSVATQASVAQIGEGVTMTALAQVIDSVRAQVTVLVQQVDIEKFQSFTPTPGTVLTSAVTPTRELPITALVEHGKTIVIAGYRTTRDSKSGRGVPMATDVPLLRELLSGINDIGSASEVAILMHARILEAPEVQIVVSETI